MPIKLHKLVISLVEIRKTKTEILAVVNIAAKVNRKCRSFAKQIHLKLRLKFQTWFQLLDISEISRGYLELVHSFQVQFELFNFLRG